jgi:hypothetical protein
MLNGLKKSLERHLPEKDRRWLVAETTDEYAGEEELLQSGWPSASNPESRIPNTEH